MNLAWGARVSGEFRNKVLDICEEFEWSAEPYASWLMACMAFESGESFAPDVRNAAGSGATGLIQFMPRTAKGLGTTCEALARMSAVEQLDFVAQYFKPYAHRIHSLSDMYMAILLPSFVGRADDSVLFQAPGIAYRQNSGLDKDRNGQITKREATSMLMSKLVKGLKAENVFQVDAGVSAVLQDT